tara:strand:- start:243 stop:551 length:309 start_codon:yes stop_codon:yes gene_type:complete
MTEEKRDNVRRITPDAGEDSIQKDFTIDVHVPLPLGHERYAPYPFDQLRISDSIQIRGSVRRRKSAQSSAHTYSKKYNVNLVTRNRREDGQMVLRVWRAPLD